MVITFKDFVETDLGIEMPEGDIPMDWFEENHLPMLVECSSCGITMASPTALVDKTDDHSYFVCESCAEVVAQQ